MPCIGSSHIRDGMAVQVTVSGISGKATLPPQIPVCSSNVYIIDTLLLPAATLATVPSVLTAIGGLDHLPPQLTSSLYQAHALS